MKKRMRIFWVLLLIFACGAWAGAAAQEPVDPDPDGIGLYLDSEATVTEIGLAPGVPLQVFLYLTRASVPAGVSGWECTIEYTGNILIMGWNLAGIGPINFESPPEFEVGLGVPTAWSPAILLLDVWLMVLDGNPCYFYVKGGPLDSLDNGFPVYAAGDDPEHLLNMWPSSGSLKLPVFAINGNPPIPVEVVSWGQVKSLYR